MTNLDSILKSRDIEPASAADAADAESEQLRKQLGKQLEWK